MTFCFNNISNRELSSELQSQKVDVVTNVAQGYEAGCNEKIPDVESKEKWNIINKLISTTTNFQVQPLEKKKDDGTIEFIFNDSNILEEIENYHIRKSDGYVNASD